MKDEKIKKFRDGRTFTREEPYDALVYLVKIFDEKHLNKLNDFFQELWRNGYHENNFAVLINCIGAYLKDIADGFYKYGEGF